MSLWEWAVVQELPRKEKSWLSRLKANTYGCLHLFLGAFPFY